MQVTANHGLMLSELRIIGADNITVVHITPVMLLAKLSFHQLVKPIQVDVAGYISTLILFLIPVRWYTGTLVTNEYLAG